ncbi:hypothetical protein ACWKT3_37295 [Streptomyces violaceus]
MTDFVVFTHSATAMTHASVLSSGRIAYWRMSWAMRQMSSGMMPFTVPYAPSARSSRKVDSSRGPPKAFCRQQTSASTGAGMRRSRRVASASNHARQAVR